MQIVTIDDGRDGSPGARLASGEFLHLSRAAMPGTVEAWLPGSVIGLLDGGEAGLDIARGIVNRARSAKELELLRERGAILPQSTRLLSPIPRPGMILAAGLAYRSHLAEMAETPTPAQPTAFLKAPSSVSPPGARLPLPSQASDQVDYEGELAVVFGRQCHMVSSDDALQFVSGYTIANDLSARDWVRAVWDAKQPWEARQTWEVNIMGKQLPGFTALGPAIVTKDEIPSPSALRLQTRLNDTIMQDATVDDLIFTIPDMIAWFSRWYTFRPGDVLLTGTPAGVGVGRKPPVFLRAGDRVDVQIEPIGTLITKIGSAE